MGGPAFDAITSAIEAKTGYRPRHFGDNWRCPNFELHAHGDRTPSLQIGNGDGRVLLYCHGPCVLVEILDAINVTMRELFDDHYRRDHIRRDPPRDKPVDLSKFNKPSQPQGDPVAKYSYYDAEGMLVAINVRYENPKTFRPYTPEPSGKWTQGLKGIIPPLYNLHGVLTAVAAGNRVWIVEGEKDADALIARGEVATTSMGGGNSWKGRGAVYAPIFRNAPVIVVRDKDDTGHAYAASIVESLEGVAVWVRVVEAAEGKDAHDHFEAGYGLNDFRPVNPDAEPTVSVKEETPKAPGSSLFRRYGMEELLALPRSFEWLARGLVVHPTHGMLGGEKKTLKTYVSLVLMLAAASGRKAFGHFEVPEAVAVMAYVGEGGRVPYTERLERIAQSMGINLRDIPLQVSFDTAAVNSERFQESLRRDLAEVKPRLVLLDPFYAFHGSDADPRNLHDEGGLLTALSEPCAEADASLAIVNHFNKTGNGRGLDRLTMVGGQEWVDSWWLLSHREVPNVASGEFRLLLEVGSRRWGGGEWELDLNVGAFDVERGEFMGEVSWDLRPHSGSSGGGMRSRVLSILEEEPFQNTKEEVAMLIGGRLLDARRMVDLLDESRVIEPRKTQRIRSDGRPYHVWTFGLPSRVGRDGTEDDGQ